MDERSDEILEQIESQRSRLGQNLDELETRVRNTADWRAQFEKNPTLMLGVALGGGILLGAMIGGGSSPRYRRGYPTSGRSRGSSSYLAGATGAAAGYTAASMESTGSSSGESSYDASAGDYSTYRQSRSSRATSPAVREQKERAAHTLDNIKAALIAFGIDKAKEFLTQALPGFERNMEEAQRQNPGDWTQQANRGSDAKDNWPEYDRSRSYQSAQESGLPGRTAGTGSAGTSGYGETAEPSDYESTTGYRSTQINRP